MINFGITVLIFLVAAITFGVEAVRVNKIFMVMSRKNKIAKDLKTIGDELVQLTAETNAIHDDIRLLNAQKDEADNGRRIAEETANRLRRQLVTFVHIIDSSYEHKQRVRYRLEILTPDETAKDSRWFNSFIDYNHLAETWAQGEDEGLHAISSSPYIANQFVVGRTVPADAETPQ